ncbi:MAG: hypothetical protein RMI43_07455, partial [Candidatus Caldarchaeum sp.]|nr:hypothetical protein [Candidatus Caldarchaeum sp.]
YLDMAARIGAWMKHENVDPSQVNKLLEILESTPETEEAITLVALHAWRQVKRGYFGRTAARELTKALQELKKTTKRKEEFRKLLATSKWVYEALQRVNANEITKMEHVLKFLAEVK